MFDNNHIDDSELLFRSILEDATEDVPQRVWQNVSDELDRIAHRKTVVLWFRRVAVTSAAAAAIALGLFFNRGDEGMLIPAATDQTMIAVVEPEEGIIEDLQESHPEQKSIIQIAKTAENRIAMAELRKEAQAEEVPAEHLEDDANSPIATEQPATETIVNTVGSQASQTQSKPENNELWQETDFQEDEKERIKASLVISGLAGTNSPQAKGGLKPFRSPAIEKAYTKTTVEQTSTNTTYGIPLSVGTGVKLDFNKHWSLGIGLNYTLLTSKFNGKYIKVNEYGTAEMTKSANVRNSQHYVGIPINAYYNIMNRDFINFYAYAGGTVEKCVMNRYEVLTTPVINHKEEVKGVQLSANVGIGVEFMLNQYLGIYIDPSLRYYFNCDQAKSIRTAQPLMLGFEMGLRFNL